MSQQGRGPPPQHPQGHSHPQQAQGHPQQGHPGHSHPQQGHRPQLGRPPHREEERNGEKRPYPGQ